MYTYISHFSITGISSHAWKKLYLRPIGNFVHGPNPYPYPYPSICKISISIHFVRISRETVGKRGVGESFKCNFSAVLQSDRGRLLKTIRRKCRPSDRKQETGKTTNIFPLFKSIWRV